MKHPVTALLVTGIVILGFVALDKALGLTSKALSLAGVSAK